MVSTGVETVRSALAWFLLIALPAVAQPSSASVSAPATLPDRPSTSLDSGLESGIGDLVLVMPLTRSGSAEPDWLGLGSARYLAEALRLAGYRVVDEGERAAALQQAGLSTDSRLPRASAVMLARQLGARFVVTGRWRQQGGRLAFSARALDVERLQLVREVEAASTHAERAIAELAEKLVADDGASRQLGAMAKTTPATLAGWMQAAAEPEQGLEHLRAALRLDPDFEPARLARAEALLDRGRVDEARALLVGLTRSDARHRRAQAMVLEGRLALATGERDEAVRALTAAAHELPETGTLLWLAEAQLAAGDSEAAGRTVRQALAQSPSDEGALELLARARREGARF